MKFLNLRFALLTSAVIVATALGAVILPHTGQTQDAPAAGQSAQQSAWAERCDDVKREDGTALRYCETFQRLSVIQGEGEEQTMQRLAEFAIGYPPEEKGKVRGALILPLGIVVDKKVKIAIDGKDALDFAVRYCDAGGCVALVDLSKGNLDRMRKGKEMTIKTEAFNGQDVQIGMSLQGFAAAFDAISPRG